MDLLYGWLLGVFDGDPTNPTRLISDNAGALFELILVGMIQRVNTKKVGNVRGSLLEAGDLGFKDYEKLIAVIMEGVDKAQNKKKNTKKKKQEGNL